MRKIKDIIIVHHVNAVSGDSNLNPGTPFHLVETYLDTEMDVCTLDGSQIEIVPGEDAQQLIEEEIDRLTEDSHVTLEKIKTVVCSVAELDSNKYPELEELINVSREITTKENA